MTLAQQGALEALAGRPLDSADIATLEPLLSVRNDVAIAAHLSIGRTARIETWLTSNMLVAHLVAATGGLAASDAILTKLDNVAATSRSIAAVMHRLENDPRGLRFDDPPMLAQIALLRQMGVFTDAEHALLDGLSISPSPLDAADISAALNGVTP